MAKEKRYNLRTTTTELRLWRETAERDGIPDLSTWFRRLAAREVERQRRRIEAKGTDET